MKEYENASCNLVPYIDKDFINDLSSRIDIVEIINKRVSLKKAGKDYKACCPFHNEKTPSFTVAPDKQIFHCFGCGESGSAIDFVIKHDHLDFVAAIETIANEAGLQVIYEKNSDSTYSKTQEYFEIMKEVSDFYSLQIRSKKYLPIISSYAKKRGLSGDVAKKFEIGYSPPGWGLLFEKFKDDEKSIARLVEMGLLIKREKKEGYYDRFRGRLMFPIHNFKGQVIAFGGRSIDEESQPKYLNSPETPLFSKSKELYGLYHARKYSRSIDNIIVVEGYMDVVSLHQHGVTNAVASLGTATTPQHIDILSKTSNNIVFCFDGDIAGKNAAWKALNIALPKIKAGLIIRFMFLPDGEDPDSIIRKESKGAFLKRVDNSITLSQFLFEHIKDTIDFNTIEGKTQFLEKAFDLIKTIEYDVYAKQILEGVANQVSQDVSKTEEMFRDFKVKNPIIFQPSESMTVIEKKSHPSNDSYKKLMGRMIQLVLNYPSIVTDNVEERVRGINNSSVLTDIIRSALLVENLTRDELIRPFKNQEQIFQRLQYLSKDLNPYLNEKQARNELLAAIDKCEKIQAKGQRSSFIRKKLEIEEQERIAEEIKKSKGI